MPPKKKPPLSAEAKAVRDFYLKLTALASDPHGEVEDVSEEKAQQMHERLLNLPKQELFEVLTAILRDAPLEAIPKSFAVALFADRDRRVIPAAERGDKKAKELLDRIVPSYTAHPHAMLAYLAGQKLKRKGGAAPQLNDEALRNEWALLRKQKPKANTSHLAQRLADQGFGGVDESGFHPDYLRRRLKKLGLL